MTNTEKEVQVPKTPRTPQHDVVDLPVKDISYDPENRLRKVDPKKVAEIKPSIAEFGLLHPIGVTETDTPGKYLLRYGAHRFEGVKELKQTTIKATILTLGSTAARIAEIDENLMIAQLSLIERGDHLAKRKELYELLHPETKKGAAQGAGMKRTAKTKSAPQSQLGSEVVEEEPPKQPPFVEDTAAKTGLSKTTIARDIERSTNVADDVKTEIAGTPLETGKVLDELKDLPHDEQRERVKEKKAAPAKPKAKRTPKGKTMPAHASLERKDQPAQDLTAQLDPFFKALWQLSVDLQKSEVRELADKIERALEKKNIVKVSERMRDASLAKLKPKTAREPSEAKSDVPH